MADKSRDLAGPLVDDVWSRLTDDAFIVVMGGDLQTHGVDSWEECHPKRMARLTKLGVNPEEAVKQYLAWREGREQRPATLDGMDDDGFILAIGCQLNATRGLTKAGWTWADWHPKEMSRLEALGIAPEEAVEHHLAFSARQKARFAPENTVRVGDVPLFDTRRPDNPDGTRYMMEVRQAGPTAWDLMEGKATPDDVRRFQERKRAAETAKQAESAPAGEAETEHDDHPEGVRREDIASVRAAIKAKGKNAKQSTIKQWLKANDIGIGSDKLQRILDSLRPDGYHGPTRR